MLRLLRQIETLAGAAPDAIAACRVENIEDHLTRRELVEMIHRIATVLRDATPTDSTVMLCQPNQPQYIAAFLGTFVAERTLFPLAAEASPPECIAAARRASVAAVIVDVNTAPAFKDAFSQSVPLAALSQDSLLLTSPSWPVPAAVSPALLLQSSGTTAEPKIARRDATSLDAVTFNMIEACKFTTADHVLAAVPLCHSYGLEHGILAPITAGSHVYVCERFDLPAVLKALKSGQITTLPGVPFMFDMIGHADGLTFPNLRRAYSAGGPLPRETFDRFLDRFGVRIGQLYGATEIGSVSYDDPDWDGFDPASVGRPMREVSIRILDADAGAGLVAVKAPSMFTGYIDDPDASLIDGHWLTGDIGRLDSRGALTITGRQKLLIDIGGRKVNPLEVEAVIARHPSVGACVVVPIQLSPTVQRLRAILVPARPDLDISIAEVRQFTQQQLSRYKVPRVFEVRQSLPTSPAGKVLRRMVEAS